MSRHAEEVMSATGSHRIESVLPTREHIYAGVSSRVWQGECLPIVDRLVRLGSGAQPAPLNAGAGKYSLLTESGLMLDQAVARTRELERQLEETRRQRLRDFAAFTAQIKAITQRLDALQQTEPDLAESGAADLQALRTRLLPALEAQLQADLRERLRSVSASQDYDDELGGDFLHILIQVVADHGSFRELRRRALEAFRRAANDVDTRAAVVTVRRCA